VVSMPFSTFDPLGNRRTSHVLFLIMRGVDTPTGIARKLGVGPTAVMDQLRKLQKVRVVQLGEKTGKEQHYTIDWGKLAEETYRHTVASRYGLELTGGKLAVEFVKKFPKFQVFLRTYLTHILSQLDKGNYYANRFMKNYPTVWELLDETHVTLNMMTTSEALFKKHLIDEPALQPFSECLREWGNRTQAADPDAAGFILRALIDLGFKRRGEVALEMATPQEDADLIATRFEALALKVGLVTKDEKTGKYELTDAGRRFLDESEKTLPKALPAWIHSRKEAKLILAKLSAIRRT
jgi:hypothetical protein